MDLLQLTMQFNVHISLSPKPLALRAEGVRSSVNALGKRLAQIKKVNLDLLDGYIALNCVDPGSGGRSLPVTYSNARRPQTDSANLAPSRRVRREPRLSRSGKQISYVAA